jgi:hypothetical protein
MRRLARSRKPAAANRVALSFRSTALALQGAYYVGAGLWPIADMDSFELVTGPKTDRWLVQTVGLLAASIGTALLHGRHAVRRGSPVRTLALTSALSFAAVGLWHGLRGRISAVYVADAVIELCIAAAVV